MSILNDVRSNHTNVCVCFSKIFFFLTFNNRAHFKVQDTGVYLVIHLNEHVKEIDYVSWTFQLIPQVSNPWGNHESFVFDLAAKRRFLTSFYKTKKWKNYYTTDRKTIWNRSVCLTLRQSKSIRRELLLRKPAARTKLKSIVFASIGEVRR